MIASDSGIRRDRLRLMLDECGIHVADVVPLDGAALKSAMSQAADFVLIDLDEACAEKLDPLLNAVETLGVPVLFNDGSDPIPPADGAESELGRRIHLKLTPRGQA
ncbi:hypothetical protein BMS3Bbin12_02270 [bacterium BMS3Bbin12]|nr:hypothetical protein BMS3Abin12_01709 [bacterium BMS3Abin12]GBE49077.1 hypothetical protein BMS3Bbin12_02270 [bacterium BMS3Bbin12]GBE50742.1 hypothetical protein BMS3Bbin13_01688 [bacterium BMS3Bbin13]